MKIATGLDLSKKTAALFSVYAGEGDPTPAQQAFLDLLNKEYRTISPSPETLHGFVNATKGHEVYLLIENSTQTYDVYWILTNMGINVTVAQSQDLYRITKSVKKTDLRDSEELAYYMRRRLNGEDEFSVCTMPPKEWMFRREMCRVVFNEKVHLGELKRRTRAHMLMHGIMLKRNYQDIFSKQAMFELSSTKDPILMTYVAEAKSIKARTDEEARYIDAMFADVRIYELIHSIPGFGSISAAYLASMIIDIRRFESCDKFTAYFGVVPKMYQSGDTNRNCRTTHRGDADARRLLMQAAFVHCNIVDYSVVSSMWNRLKANGKSFREIQVACARKLLTVVWAVLRNNRMYEAPADLLQSASDKADSLLEEPE